MAALGSMNFFKYGWGYPMSSYMTVVRVVPHSNASISDLDQFVTALGGLVALLISLRDAFKERRRARVRS